MSASINTINLLTPGAECYIDAMHLSAEDQAFVRGTIYWYGNNHTLEVFLSLLYRIINAIKECFPCIFSKSDWQQSLEIIENRAIGFVREERNGSVRLYDRHLGTNPQRNEQLNAIIRNAARQIAEAFLNHCYMAHTGEERTEEVDRLIPRMDLQRFADRVTYANFQLLT